MVYVPAYREKLKQENISQISGLKAYEDPQLVEDLQRSLGFIFPYLINQDMPDAIKWLVGWIDYCNDKNGNNQFFKKMNFTIERGKGVQVNLFGHMGVELTYDHPAIVLSESRDWIIIAPTSSTCYQDEEDLHIDLTPGDGNVVDKNCGIKLENIRMISKKRVKTIFKGKITNEKMDEIDQVLAEHLSPHVDQLVKDLQEKLKEQEGINSDLENDLADKENEIAEKDQEILRLQRELDKVEVN